MYTFPSCVSINLKTYYFRKSLINVRDTFLYFLEPLTPQGILRVLHIKATALNQFQNYVVLGLNIYEVAEGKEFLRPIPSGTSSMKTTLLSGGHAATHLQCKLR